MMGAATRDRAPRAPGAGAAGAADRAARSARVFVLVAVCGAADRPRRSRAPVAARAAAAAGHQRRRDHSTGSAPTISAAICCPACSTARGCRCWSRCCRSCVSGSLVGTLLGMIAGFRRGWDEVVIMRVVDIVLSIPRDPARGPHRRGARAGLHQADPGARLHPLAALHPRRLCARPCRSSNLPYINAARARRRRSRAHPAPPRAAEHRSRRCSSSRRRVRPDDPVRGGAVVPRPRHPAADAELGLDHERRPQYVAPPGGSPPFPASACSCWCCRSMCSATGCATASTPRRRAMTEANASGRSRAEGRGDRRRRDLRRLDRRSAFAREGATALPVGQPRRGARTAPGELGVARDATLLHATELRRTSLDPRPRPARASSAGARPTSSINNAGVYPRGLLLDIAATEWDRIMDVNLRAPFLVTREMARLMIAAGVQGAIVNISSGARARCATARCPTASPRPRSSG